VVIGRTCGFEDLHEAFEETFGPRDVVRDGEDGQLELLPDGLDRLARAVVIQRVGGVCIRVVVGPAHVQHDVFPGRGRAGLGGCDGRDNVTVVRLERGGADGAERVLERVLEVFGRGG
jgi:hypothetical protein